MKVVYFFGLFMVMVFLVGCFEPQPYMLDKDEKLQNRIQNKTGISNLATLYCMNETGTYWSTKETRAGEMGICNFDDGTWCEEWAFFRGECERGMNYTTCEGKFWGKTICDGDYDPVCGKVLVLEIDESGEEKIIGDRWEEFNNDCSACIDGSKTERVVGYQPGGC